MKRAIPLAVLVSHCVVPLHAICPPMQFDKDSRTAKRLERILERREADRAEYFSSPERVKGAWHLAGAWPKEKSKESGTGCWLVAHVPNRRFPLETISIWIRGGDGAVSLSHDNIAGQFRRVPSWWRFRVGNDSFVQTRSSAKLDGQFENATLGDHSAIRLRSVDRLPALQAIMEEANRSFLSQAISGTAKIRFETEVRDWPPGPVLSRTTPLSGWKRKRMEIPDWPVPEGRALETGSMEWTSGEDAAQLIEVSGEIALDASFWDSLARCPLTGN